MFGECQRELCACMCAPDQTEEENDKKALRSNELSFSFTLYIYIVFVLSIGKWEMLKENFYDKAKFLPCNLMNHTETNNIMTENIREDERRGAEKKPEEEKEKTLRTRQ